MSSVDNKPSPATMRETLEYDPPGQCFRLGYEHTINHGCERPWCHKHKRCIALAALSASPADPKPAPDAMREATLATLVQELFDLTTPVHDASKFINLTGEMAENGWWKRAKAALSAPVPPPDGAAATLLVPASDDAATLAGSTERASIRGHAPCAGTKTPPSDDVRSALADQIEREGVHVYGTSHPCETVKQIIVAALRSAPVSALAVGVVTREAIPESALWALISTLHENVAEDDRPMSWSDFSDEQAARLKKAAGKFVEALTPSPVQDATGAGESETELEERLLKQDAQDMLRLIDYIADKIGLPQDEELSHENFLTWFASQQDAVREAVIEECPKYEFPYQRTFDAIIAATDVLSGPPNQKQLSISVQKFQDAFNSHRDQRALSTKEGGPGFDPCPGCGNRYDAACATCGGLKYYRDGF